MIGTLGSTAVLLGLGAAAAGTVVGFRAGATGSEAGLQWTRRLGWVFAIALLGANLIMEWGLLTRDFTVRYVDQVGSHEVPTWVAIVSLWSALEGSILFWGAILAVYTAGFLVFAKKPEYRRYEAYSIATILAIGTFFCFLIAGPADPFGTVIPKPVHVGPNPLLQNHILMVVHPPMLYLGYVGMTIPFAMGCSALLTGHLGAGWQRPMRHWMLLPWGFLTVGIVLGGWWAYEVLGWGGYWAWDPVENASFLPWLTATGFLHAAMLQERRGVLKGWTLVLLVATFLLTILGTFMTRSGVFNSVHSFTQSPIGPTFLGFLAVAGFASVGLLGLRMHLLVAEGEIKSPVSREAAFVANNALFVAFTLSVLIGTTFPLVAEAVRGVKLSVGEPYFNLFAAPIGVFIVFLMGVGPALPWGRATPKEAARALQWPLAWGFGGAVLGFALGARDPWVAATLLVSGFAIAVAGRDMLEPVFAIQRRRKLGSVEAAKVAFQRGRRRYGGQIVHVGVAVMAVAIAVSWTYQDTRELVVRKGEPAQVGAYTLRFEGKEAWREDHREVVAANLTVLQGERVVAELQPRMNKYTGQMSPIGTPAVRTTLARDIYLSVMQIDEGGQYVGLRVFLNPLVVWIWLASGIMVLGCVIAAWPNPPRETAAP